MKGHVLDTLDRNIITLLRADGRMSFTEIARRLRVSEGTVRRRTKELTSHRIITPTIVISPSALGSSTIAILGIRVDPGRIRAIAAQLSRYDEIRYLAYATGAYDLIAEVIVPTNEDLLRFVTDDLSQIEGVLRTDTSVVPQVIKATYHEAILQDRDLEAGVSPSSNKPVPAASR